MIYVITNDRFSPNPDEATIDDIRAMCADNDWNVTLTERDGRVYDERGEVVAVSQAEYEGAE